MGELEPSPATAASLGMEVFQAHPTWDDEQIEAELAGRGLRPAMAGRVIQFLPMAFCRVLLAPQGVKFPAEYEVMGPDGQKVGEYLLEDEPVFVAATALAHRELADGRAGQPFIALAARSGSFQAVMELIQQGSRPDQILCSRPILMRDNDPSGTQSRQPETVRKPWWQRWRS